MAGAAKGKVAKTASKNNPSSRKAAKKMSFNGVIVKGVRVIGFNTVLPNGQSINLNSFIAIANAQTEDLIVDANGVPYDFKHAKPEA